MSCKRFSRGKEEPLRTTHFDLYIFVQSAEGSQVPYGGGTGRCPLIKGTLTQTEKTRTRIQKKVITNLRVRLRRPFIQENRGILPTTPSAQIRPTVPAHLYVRPRFRLCTVLVPPHPPYTNRSLVRGPTVAQWTLSNPAPVSRGWPGVDTGRRPGQYSKIWSRTSYPNSNRTDPILGSRRRIIDTFRPVY